MSNLYKILEVLMKSSRLEIKVTRDNEGTSVANMCIIDFAENQG